MAKLARRSGSLWRCSRGTVAVEFAFVFPLLIILVIGIYSVGAVMHSISSVRFALEETARVLQMKPDLTESELQDIIDEKLTSYGKQAITLTMAVAKDSFGSDIAHLTASYPFTIAVPFIPKYEGAYQQSVEIFLVIAE
jgi:Flp pilus assembly protein TadG